MTDRQIVNLNMVTVVDAVFKEGQTVLEAVSPLSNAYLLFSEKLAVIKKLATHQTYNSTGLAGGKQAVKEEMAKLASELAKAALSYAYDHNDMELMTYFRYSYSSIRFATNNEAEMICKIILDELRNIVTELTDYLVTEEDLARLQGLIEKYSSIRDDMSVSSTESVLATRNLQRSFSEINDLLEIKIDALVGRLKDRYPEFAEKYEKAREFHGLAKSKAGDIEAA